MIVNRPNEIKLQRENDKTISLDVGNQPSIYPARVPTHAAMVQSLLKENQ